MLLLGTNCQSQSWGRFWEPNQTNTAVSSCEATVVSDIVAMICVNANTAGFSMGSNAVGGSSIPEHMVSSISAFAMAKYEVQYGEWQMVKNWAMSNGYIFANPGVQGDNGLRTDQHPVTSVNWRDAIIWCNAASEKQGLVPVYYADSGFATVIRTSYNTASIIGTAGSGTIDFPFVNKAANGFRLPTEAEWEYASRYNDGLTFSRGDAPSGWSDNNLPNTNVDTLEIDAVAWWTNNSGAITSIVGARIPNSLGLFDMSGNVYEWVWDWEGNYTLSTPYTDDNTEGPATGTFRLYRGGYFNGTAANLLAAHRNYNNPWFANTILGFRPVRRP